MTQQEIDIILTLLQRVNLQGNEVAAYIQAVSAVRNSLDQPKEAAPKEEPAPKAKKNKKEKTNGTSEG